MAKHWSVKCLAVTNLLTLSVILYLSSTILAVKFHSNSLACRGPDGKPIDWTLTYKLPKLETHVDTLIKSGAGSIFVTSAKTDHWSVSESSIDSTKHLIGATVAQLLKNKSKLDLLVAYNDDPPGGKRSSESDDDYNLTNVTRCGQPDDASCMRRKTTKRPYESKTAHAKGFVAISGDTGFWLMHSVPKFPNLSGSTYHYAPNGHRNGQNLLCVSLSASDKTTLNVIADHLLTMRPTIYKVHVSEKFGKKFPSFKAVKSKKWTHKTSNVAQILSAQKASFTTYVKSGKFNKDIYADLIAKHTAHDIAAQTWRQGKGGILKSDCDDKYHVMNINEIRYDPKSEWKHIDDHSKWAVSTTSSNNLWCIGDLNRMASQFPRGGGAICIKSAPIWQRYFKILQEVEPCPK